MHPQLNHLMSQERVSDMRHEADRRRFARDVASEGQPVGRRSGAAQLFAWLGITRASGGYEEGSATAVSKRLTHEPSGVSDVAVARGDAG